MDLLAYINWNISPEIFELGPLKPRWYGLLFALGFIVGYQLMTVIFKKEGKPQKDLDKLTIFMVIGTVVGARLGHCLFYEPARYLADPIAILKIWQGGLASHGAAVGILLIVWVFVRNRKDVTYLWVFDRVVIVVALAGFFIRLGNFFNSEILGMPSELPWAVIFSSVDNIPRHPAQLYEAFSYLIIFVLLWFNYLKKTVKMPEGQSFGLFLILVFTSRFLIEFVKEVQVGFENDMLLNMGQLLSIPLILAGVYLYLRSLKVAKI